MSDELKFIIEALGDLSEKGVWVFVIYVVHELLVYVLGLATFLYSLWLLVHKLPIIWASAMSTNLNLVCTWKPDAEAVMLALRKYTVNGIFQYQRVIKVLEKGLEE